MLFQGDFWGNITFQKVQHYSDSSFIALEVSGVALIWSSVLKQAWGMEGDITH